MSNARTCLLVFAATMAWGCKGTSDVSGPGTKGLDLVVTPASPLTVFGVSGSEIIAPFSVKVVDYPDRPVPGMVVTFKVDSTQIPAGSAVTDADGIATLSSVRLDLTPGQYTVSATAGESTLRPAFQIAVLSQSPIAVYDLISVGGKSVSATSQFVSHYVLFANGTYLFGTEPNFLRYSAKFDNKGGQTLSFYLVPASNLNFTPDPKDLFSTGTVNGETMAVTYQATDPYFGSYPDEVYALRK